MVNEEDTGFVSLLQKAKLLSHSTSLSKNDLKPFSSHDGRLLSKPLAQVPLTRRWK